MTPPPRNAPTDRGRPTSLDRLLAQRITADSSSALITAYDDATGERIELSSATFGNWVAKTANFLVDELDVSPGDCVRLDLPLHWQTLVWAQACWCVGAAVVLSDQDDLDVMVTTTDRAAQLERGLYEIVACALLPMARPHPSPTKGVFDYDREVPTYGDRFTGPACDPNDVAVELDGTSVTHNDVIDQATKELARHPLDPKSRVAVITDTVDLAAALRRALVVPLLIGGGSVIQAGPRPSTDAWGKRLTQEHAQEWPPVESTSES